MATKSTGWSCTHTASVTAETETTVTIKVECFWTNIGWDYDINHVSAWVFCGTESKKVKDAGSIDTGGNTSASVSCGSATFVVTKTTAAQNVSCYAKITSNSSYVSGTKTSTKANVAVSTRTSYAITYDLNGGTSAAIASQKKYHGINLTITSTVPTRSGYEFVGWALTDADADAGKWYYTPESTCGQNKSLTLYAVWKSTSYTITYNKNAGSDTVSNMPSNQTKQPNTNVALSSNTPTRTGYIFKGWTNSATSSTIIYNPGDTYTVNASITLYAVWTSVQLPSISNLKAFRCDADGTADKQGTYAKIEFDWSSSTSSISSSISTYEGTSTTVYLQTTASRTGANGTVTVKLGTTAKPFSLEKAYTVKVTVQNKSGSSVVGTVTASIVLGEEDEYSLEFIPNNTGVYFPKDVRGNVLGLAGLPEIPNNADYNNYTSTGVWGVKTNAIAATLDNRPIDQAGRLIVAHAIGGQPDNSEFDYLIQTYIPYLVSYNIYERHIRKTGTSTWIYSPWVVITRNRHSMISAWTGSDITKTEYAETQIPLTGKTVVGDGFTIKDNAIVIGQYITAVEVSAAGMVQHASQTTGKAINLTIKKNGTAVAQSLNSAWSTQGSNFQLNVSSKLISVAENDKITLHWQADTNDKLSSANARTYITVKEF